MAEAILSVAVESIGKLLLEEATFLHGVSDQVRQLHTDLRRMQWFVEYVDKKPGATDVQQWVTEFREIVYEANDVIEDYAFRVASRKKDGCIKRCACILNESHARHNLGLEIQSLTKRISDLIKKFNEFGGPAIIQEGSSSSRQKEKELRWTHSFVKEEDFVSLKSLDVNVEMILKSLLNEEVNHYSVVSIYGMGGLGKTTLAKQVYHHPRLKSYFNGFAWACISQQCKPTGIFQDLLPKLVPDLERSEIKEATEGELAKRLYQVLRERKCLIVLDDIWSKDAWDCLKDAFSISDQGSKILITTRNRDVASYIGPDGYHHQPQPLNEEESWELLQKKALLRKSGKASASTK